MKYTLLVSLFLFSVNAHAITHKSGFGFTVKLDDNWVAMGKQQTTKANKETSLKSLKSLNINDKKAGEILKLISSGGVEFLFDKKSATSDFKNNIRIQKTRGATARTKEQGASACKTLGAELKKVFKKDIKVTQCSMKSINRVLFMSYEYTGAIDNIITMHNEFQFTPNLTLVTVGRSQTSAAEPTRKTQNKISTAIAAYIKASPDYFTVMKKATNALKQKQYKNAYQQYRILASAGDPEGLFNTAAFNEHGKGTAKNLKIAFTYYEKAARAGNRQAITKLGDFYMNGKATKKDMGKAAKLFYQAGLLGDPVAQNIFATMLFDGIGMEKKNPQEALKWFEQSAKQGYQPAAQNLIQIYNAQIKNKNPKANHALAVLYLRGIGVKQDANKAIKLLEKAAFEGVNESRQALFEIYSKGLFGVAKNPEKAKVWQQQ